MMTSARHPTRASGTICGKITRMKFSCVVRLVVALLFVTQASAQQLLPGEREAVVTGIPGVIDAGTKWQLVWADFKTADGIVGTPDGGVIFAQEQTDTIRKLDANNKEYIYLTDTHGGGSVSMDAQGRVYAVQRACTDSARPFYQSCEELPMISILAPERRLLANSFSTSNVALESAGDAVSVGGRAAAASGFFVDDIGPFISAAPAPHPTSAQIVVATITQ